MSQKTKLYALRRAGYAGKKGWWGVSLKIGDFAEWSGADSYYAGYVISIFDKGNGQMRCIVKDDRGLLLIKNPEQGVVRDRRGWLIRHIELYQGLLEKEVGDGR